MSRPLRIEFPNALYHLTSHSSLQQPVFTDKDDRIAFLNVLAQCCERMDASVHAYCLMDDHYELVLTTRRANLSVLMRQLNGVYTQAVNRRRGNDGPVFQGRFKSVVVDRKAYFLQLCLAVDLSPQRLGVVRDATKWKWSSLGAHTGAVACPPWLDAESVQAAVLGLAQGQTPANAAARQHAQQHYASQAAGAAAALATSDASLLDNQVTRQMFLGNDAFIDRVQRLAVGASAASKGAARKPAAKSLPVAHWLKKCATREEALHSAYAEGGMTMTAIAAEVGLTVGRVSQLIRKCEGLA
jgi:putative transposase